MATYTVSPLADLDLFEIGLRIARDNPRAADRLIDDITGKFQVLAERPHMGVARDELRPGLRLFPTRGYLIFYRLVTNGVEIVRVLNAKRDVDAAF